MSVACILKELKKNTKIRNHMLLPLPTQHPYPNTTLNYPPLPVSFKWALSNNSFITALCSVDKTNVGIS